MKDINVNIHLLAPLVHGAFDMGDIGNATAIRRLPIVGIEGNPKVPVLSGNALRSRTRRIVMRSLLGVLENDIYNMPSSTWDRLYAALCNGGHIEKSVSKVNPGEMLELRESLPPLSVWGSALYSTMIPGRMSVGWCWPVCIETVKAGLVSPRDDVPLLYAEELVYETSLSRHPNREIDPKVSGVTSMVITVETLATGTRLHSRIRFDPDATEIERSAVSWGLDHIDHMGGKIASGFGSLEISHDGNSEPYKEWFNSNKEQARGALLSLAEQTARTSRGKKL